MTNEAWNALLFGFDSVAPAAMGMIAFTAIAATTGILVHRADRTAGYILTPYIAWVAAYDLPWIVAAWHADL